jgi:signal transduction histidine kinase
MMLSVSAVRARLSDAVSADHFEKLQQLLEAVDRELDRIVFTLRPTALEDAGLDDAITAHVSTWSELSRLPVDLLVKGLDGQRLPPRVEAAVFRVIQEALNNIAKHTHASSVSVERIGRQLVDSVEDDGVGFDAEQAAPVDTSRPSWGLLGMSERIEVLGGTFTIESRAGGSTVLLRGPLH